MWLQFEDFAILVVPNDLAVRAALVISRAVSQRGSLVVATALCAHWRSADVEQGHLTMVHLFRPVFMEI